MDLSLLQDLFVKRIGDWFSLTPESSRVAGAISSAFLVLLVASIADRSLIKLIGWLVPKIVQRLGSEAPREWESALDKRLVAKRSAHIFGTLIFYWLITFALKDYPAELQFFRNIIEGYLVITAVLTINAILKASRDVWDDTGFKIGVPIRFATQALQILVWVVGSILAISVSFDQSVTVLLSGLAGMTAILALVFKDSILGFVAGIQLSGNDMLRTGDWIDVPQYGANGNVNEIGLTTVKVQNFDKTISTVPSYALVSSSFQNWRGMWDFKARRIKRSLRLDMNRVCVLNEEDVARIQNIAALKTYWADRENRTEPNSVFTGDIYQLTNLSLYGDYLKYYLDGHPDIYYHFDL